MGRVMDEFRGRVPATEVVSEIRKHIPTTDRITVGDAGVPQGGQNA